MALFVGQKIGAEMLIPFAGIFRVIYIGHFSFKHHDERPDTECCHGYFTSVVEASSVEKALVKFEALLRRLQKTSTVFDGLENIYLESCTEIGAVPKNGFLAYFVEIRGDSFGELSTELVGVSGNKVNAYQLAEDHADEGADSAVVEPFLIF
jgi:hypothetical protein